MSKVIEELCGCFIELLICFSGMWLLHTIFEIVVAMTV